MPGAPFCPMRALAVGEAAEALQAARRAARPAKAVFSVGFLTGQEVDWLPHVTRILRAELPKIEFKVTSMYSPDLAEALQNGEIDLGFLRVEPKPDVTYEVIAKEPIVVILPSDHPLAAEKAIDPKALEGETLVGIFRYRDRAARGGRGLSAGKGRRTSRRAIASRISRWFCRWSHRSAAWRSCRPMSRRCSRGRS